MLPLVGVICFAVLAFVAAAAFVYYSIPASVMRSSDDVHYDDSKGYVYKPRDIRNHNTKYFGSFLIMIGCIGAAAGIGVNHLH